MTVRWTSVTAESPVEPIPQAPLLPAALTPVERAESSQPVQRTDVVASERAAMQPVSEISEPVQVWPPEEREARTEAAPEA